MSRPDGGKMPHDKLSLFWPHPLVQFNGRGISEAWAEELSAYGFEPTRTPERCDIAFFISDSQLDERVIANLPTVAYFWGWPPERLLDHRERWVEIRHRPARCRNPLWRRAPG